MRDRDMQAFHEHVDRYAVADAAQRAALEDEIWQRYGTDRAVLALDMSEFSLSVRRDGILSYLCRIRRMRALTEPVVLEHGGGIVKYEADNLLAEFPVAARALDAALVMRRLLLDDAQAQRVSIGLSFGRILLIPLEDAYGDAVNLAFKLGEDIAHAGEILASREFVDALGEPRPCGMELQTISIAGLRLEAYRITG